MTSEMQGWAETFESFVGYCTRSAPAFAARLVGATQGDLRRVETASGLPLPADYRTFLSTFGRTPQGALDAFLEHHEYGVERVVAFYKRPTIPVPRDAIYLWTLDYDHEMFESFAGTGAIVQFGWSRDDETGEWIDSERFEAVVAPSLMELLYREAFMTLRLPSLPFVQQLRERDTFGKPDPARSYAVGRQVHDVGIRLGLGALPFVASPRVFLDGEASAIGLFGETHAPDSLHVAAASQRELHRVVETLLEHTRFERWA